VRPEAEGPPDPRYRWRDSPVLPAMARVDHPFPGRGRLLNLANERNRAFFDRLGLPAN